jgi:hypothetical protein
MRNPFRYFNSSPEVIRLTVMMYIRYPLSLRQVEDILFERDLAEYLPGNQMTVDVEGVVYNGRGGQESLC